MIKPTELHDNLSQHASQPDLHSGEQHDYLLKILKPVLKKNIMHSNNNVIMTFRSIEIQIFEDLIVDGEKRTRSMMPLFVPLLKL